MWMLLLVTSLPLADCGHFSGQCNPNFYKTPKCLNTPGAYYCECGAGFEWNSKQCISRSVDSRLEYSDSEADSYAVLLGKNFPALQAFTVGLWLRLNSADYDGRNGTILAYGFPSKKTEELWLSIGAGFFTVRIRGQESSVRLRRGLPHDKWLHVACTWTSAGGVWALFVDGRLAATAGGLAPGETIRAGGRLEIGVRRSHNLESAGRPDAGADFGDTAANATFDHSVSFKGDVSYFNMWSSALADDHIADMHQDCTFTYCGDVTEWVDFRTGTRGELKLRWPSGVFESCIRDKAEGCDTYCTETIGPQCQQEFAENIEWPRTPVGETSYMPCPGDSSTPPVDNDGTSQDTDVSQGSRPCLGDGITWEEADRAEWGEADVTECLSEDVRLLQDKIGSLYSNISQGLAYNRSKILTLLEELHRNAIPYRSNPADITADVYGVRMLVAMQNATLGLEGEGQWAGLTDAQGRPTTEDIFHFATVACNIFDIILDERNHPAWRGTAPRGAGAVRVLQAIQDFADLMANGLLLHAKPGGSEIGNNAMWTHTGANFAFHVRVVQPENFEGLVLPDSTPGMASLNDENGYVDIPETLFEEMPENGWPENVVISYTRYNSTLPEYLPNHPEPIVVKFYRDKAKEHLHKEDNVNSVIITTRVHLKDDSIVFTNTSDPISYVMKYKTTMNISNPECVTLATNPTPNDWEWMGMGCEVTESDGEHAQCSCSHLGTFAITTDMYDVNWDPGEPPHFYLTVASYIGILVSLSLFTTSMAVFIYLRCETDTVAVHRNLGLSMICLQLCYFIGITRDENETVCKVFAIAIHFFFLSTFAWICNEAFNLYMEVVNTIHADTQQQRNMLRYYIIGYVFPAVLVGAVVKIKWDTYFSSDVCLLDTNHIWFLIGPAIGLWVVTVFVLVYTGKAIMESSYSKDREANKVVGNHCKGCWIQSVLMLVTWAFAITSILMFSVIPQILFAMFNIFQGAFFFVFFCVLNSEVVEILAERRATLGLTVSPSIPRSTKYSVYRRYVPIKALAGSGRRRTQHPIQPPTANAPASPKEARHHLPSSAGEASPDLHNEEMMGVKGHRFLAGASSGPDSPLIGVGSSQLQRKFKGKKGRAEETSMDVIAIRPPSDSSAEVDTGDIVTTV
ncbi:adhesion G protein-coupled receptor L3-like [Acanthaster planci]|uniref:Adhesion G protein-coupled receptor L3-like n=1 Tax=Acanthaster planci TaxID=133434 RepID=A0A8B7XI76_ACAPL|nr:adhesion G protein-coupled receptor L3-like [Acanthaster planci]XP_022079836.1 adhesion G protein-coupled receptor L3-like [Acanthaster planci]